eukprot:1748187-Heterocapsa_arctica.AAC.1
MEPRQATAPAWFANCADEWVPWDTAVRLPDALPALAPHPGHLVVDARATTLRAYSLPAANGRRSRRDRLCVAQPP